MVFRTVDEGSVAANAGIRAGDKLVAVNGREIDELADLRLLLRDGTDELKLTLQRGQEEVVIEIDPTAIGAGR